MKRLPIDDFFQLTEWNRGSYKAAVHRNEVAMAFGLDRLLHKGICLDLDVVVEEFVRELAPNFSRKFAATIAISFSDLLAEAVSKADVGTHPVFFLVASYGEAQPRRGSADRLKTGKVIDIKSQQFNGDDFAVNVAVWDLAEPQSPYKTGGDEKLPDRIIAVNVKKLLARVRERGRKLNIDLSAPFCPPPSDPAFQEEQRQFKKWREEQVGRVKLEQLSIGEKSPVEPRAPGTKR